MQVRIQVALLLVAYLALSASGLPPRKRNAHIQRVRRKVGQLNITSTPVEYMRDLLSNIADEDGKPTDLVQNPTTVWCFTDEGRPTRLVVICVCVCGNVRLSSFILVFL